MEKIIELNKQGVGRLVDYESFLLPDEITLKFVAKGYDLSNAFIHLQNGENKGVFKLVSPFKIPSEYLLAGYLNMRVESYIGEIVAKRWDVLPIKIIEIPSGYEIRDYLGELESKIIDLTGKVEKLEKQHEIIL
jgi:hypothetical protein